MIKIKLDIEFKDFLLEIAEEDVCEFFWYWLEIGNKKYILTYDDEDSREEEDEIYDGWYIKKFSKILPDGNEIYYECELNLNDDDVKRFEKLRLNMKLNKKLPEKTKTKTLKI